MDEKDSSDVISHSSRYHDTHKFIVSMLVTSYLAILPFKDSPFFASYMLLSYKNKCDLL